MSGLNALGFLKGVTVETIVSTYNGDEEPNAAPMGATMMDAQHLVINLFNSSGTCANIRTKKCAVVNLTSDVEVFYKTAFKEVNPNGVLPQEWFEKAKTVNAPKLRLAAATIDVSVASLAISTKKTKAIFVVELVQAARKYPEVYCRAFGATIEAIIHATRVKALANEKKEQKRVSELSKKIAYCNDVVGRVAPNSRYSLVMADLMKRINSWEQK